MYQRLERPPAVAGTFYEASEKRLREQLRQCFLHPLGPGSVPVPPDRPLSAGTGLLLPHAGYMYSGPTAAKGVAALADLGTPEIAVIVGPSHMGTGEALALSAAAAWRTPLGASPIDAGLCQALVKAGLPADENAHLSEHSLEVELPFLQFIYGPSLRIVPIAMAEQGMEASVRLGRAMADTLKGFNAVVIASSDFTHYEPHVRVEEKDRIALEAIQALDVGGLYRAIESHGITMCGYGPVAAMLTACLALGASRAALVSHTTSGDTSGDYSSVVGYAAVLVS